MKLIYVSGPYRAKNTNGVYHNIQKARRFAECIWAMGLYALCPHLNTAFMDGVVEDAKWLEGDLVMVARCDGIYMIEGWEKSEGARLEHECAIQNNIPIFYTLEDLGNHAW